MKDFLRLIRWKNILIVVLTMCLMKYAVIAPVYRYYNLNMALENSDFLLLLLSVVSILIAGNIINDYFDRKTDTINKPNKVIIGFTINRRKAILFDILFNVLGIVSGAILMFHIGKPLWILLLIFSVFLLRYYSMSLKRKLLIGNILVAVYVAIIPLLVGLTEYFAFENSIESWDKDSIHALKFCMQTIIAFSIFAFIYTFLREIIKDCEDYRGDLQTGIRSLPTVLGRKTTNYIICMISLIAIAFVLLFWHKYFGNIHFIKFFAFGSIYIYCFIILPSFLIAIISLSGVRKQKYTNMNTIVKFIMFFGVMFSLLFCL